MELSEKDLLAKTNGGLNIYAHILRRYYQGEVVLRLVGKVCEITRNPFYDDSLTLQIAQENGQFMFKDILKPEFVGSAFTFASWHYKLEGQALLQLLNKNMPLRIGEIGWYASGCQANTEKTYKKPLQIPMFSYYKGPVSNTLPEKNVSLLEVFHMIQGTQFLKRTEYLRTLKDSVAARSFKAKHFDYVTFSGLFSKRNDRSLLKHSGLVAIDFDHVDQVADLKNQLLEDKYFETELLFTSPSGDGIKWIISIDLTEVTHKEYFQAVSAYIEHNYKLKIDSAGKDVSRACFLPYDNEAYINPKYLPKC
ncbi:BT4734/BF3469 family protein [Porifericola rhodea]|uniref:BT4734/BF3469 family protein n=1 Tax=Porifericola rhodea TaxID=930972 RepID=UPI002664EFBF|nr:BT4734/BF3469 family protein [Porifericola rhodea]WKN29753.1 BT4734/BF3469 family protein [Porifericola rhodea]